MNLESLKDKTVLLFGQSRAFSAEEFEAQLKVHAIELVREFRDDVTLIIDGKMMTPYEEIESERIYELKDYKFTTIDTFESKLAELLDEDTLLMSLKLSGDKGRLKAFLQNSMTTNDLFLKLLKMYNWADLDFFESDDNRDVSAALIRRYYKNIEQNHNVEYASLGILHLVSQTNSSELITTISSLPPMKFNENIKAMIATHLNTDISILESFIKDTSSYIKTLIAMRKDLSNKLQETLNSLNDESVNEALSYNTNLSKSIVLKLKSESKYAKNIAEHIKLDDELFELFKVEYAESLAKNNTLTYEMQDSLYRVDDKSVTLSLASNDKLNENLISELLIQGIEDINIAIYENTATPEEDLIKAYDNKLNHLALSHNENTPRYILKLLAESGDTRVLLGLAANPNTPIDILYQLQLDASLSKVVKTNKTFLENIKTENIGWL